MIFYKIYRLLRWEIWLMDCFFKIKKEEKKGLVIVKMLWENRGWVVWGI